MIEALIDYIRGKGYLVDALPGMLIIRKFAIGELCSLAWGIPSHDLQPELMDGLRFMADQRIAHIEQAILEHMMAGGPPK